MPVAAIVGLDNRATMDLDTTLKNLPLKPDSILKALTEICTVNADDNIVFEVGNIEPIRNDDIYGGYRAHLTAIFDTMKTPLSIDVTTGDVITPNAVEHSFGEIFSDDTYKLWAYNIETIMAEKVETILRRTVFNTRPRDFYDAYILASTKGYDEQLFREALKATAEHRGTTKQISDVEKIILTISESQELRDMWSNYRKQFAYASDIEFEDIIERIKMLLI